MKHIAIIGGGISGLAAAFTLEGQRRAGAPVEYALFESSPRFGGVIATERVENFLVEAGPDSCLTEKPWPRLWSGTTEARWWSVSPTRCSPAFTEARLPN